MKSKFISIFAFAWLAACQSRPAPAPVEVVDRPVRDAETEAAAAPDEPIQPRFCNDDLYTQHIQSEVSRLENGPSASEEVFKALRYQLPLEFAGSPISPSPRVLSWISYFTGRGRSEFLLWMVRSASYRETLVPLLKNEGLPEELFFLPMIESGFSNYAFSHASASGTWQFMKPTAEHYGLKVNYWVDERRDPVKSTLAAARYLKDLHQQFGDWYLALAAYNTGPSRVVRAMRATKSRDYWVLASSRHLHSETRDYVPKLLAALIVASHASTYGFDVVADVRMRTPEAQIPLQAAYSVDEMARKLGVPTEQLSRWNPELLQTVTPPIHPLRRSLYSLRVPKSLETRWASIEGDLQKLDISDVLLHKIRKGETIAGIARQYKVSVQKILAVNPNVKPSRLKLGSTLTVPVPSMQTPAMGVQAVNSAKLPSSR